jgi:hypothetical protein
MILLFLCGVLRVSIPSGYLVTALLQPGTARALMVPFAAFVLVIAGYDAWRRRHR